MKELNRNDDVEKVDGGFQYPLSNGGFTLIDEEDIPKLAGLLGINTWVMLGQGSQEHLVVKFI